MSIEKIIQESINKNPLAMKEALEEELRSRVALALEAKKADMEDDGDDGDDDDDDEDESLDEGKNSITTKSDIRDIVDKYEKLTGKKAPPGTSKQALIVMINSAEKKMKESFDLSEYTVEELEDFMESAEFDQLDEISKKTLTSYYHKAKDDKNIKNKKSGDAHRAMVKNTVGSPEYTAHKKERDHWDKKTLNRRRGMNRAVDRLAR